MALGVEGGVKFSLCLRAASEGFNLRVLRLSLVVLCLQVPSQAGFGDLAVRVGE